MHRAAYSHGDRVHFAAFAVALLAMLLPLIHATTAAAAVLDRVRQASKLTLGYRTDARPFSYRDEQGNAAGYSVVLCQKIAEQIKLDLGLSTLSVQWVPVTVEDRFRAVEEGKIDLLCGAASATLARRKEVAFSIPIFPGGIGALLRSDSNLGLRDVLSGRQPSEFALAWITSSHSAEADFFGGRTHDHRELAGRQDGQISTYRQRCARG